MVVSLAKVTWMVKLVELAVVVHRVEVSKDFEE